MAPEKKLMLEASGAAGFLRGMADGPMSDEDAAGFLKRTLPSLKQYSERLSKLVDECLAEETTDD